MAMQATSGALQSFNPYSAGGFKTGAMIPSRVSQNGAITRKVNGQIVTFVDIDFSKFNAKTPVHWLQEESVTGLGKIFDGIFGIGNRQSVYGKVSNYVTGFFSSTKSDLPASELPSIKKRGDIEREVEEYLNNNPQFSVERDFPCCSGYWGYPGLPPGLYYSQECLVQSNDSFYNLGEQSNDPKEFAISFQRCLADVVVNKYFDEVASSRAAKICDFELNNGIEFTLLAGPSNNLQQIEFSVSGGIFAEMFADQETILFSQALIDTCYEENLTQQTNLYPNASTISEGNTAAGTYNVNYPNEFCTNSYSFQTWELALAEDPSVSSLYASYFTDLYMGCSIEKVNEYFSGIERNATCALLDTSVQVLPYSIAPYGNFTITAVQGFLPDQLTSEFMAGVIGECYTQSYKAYRAKQNTLNIMFVTVGLITVPIFLCLSGCVIWNRKNLAEKVKILSCNINLTR